MDKDHYDKLPVEQRWTISKAWLDIIQGATSARMGLLPLISGLSAALLVVATFNEKLIPLDDTIRLIISVLLLLIPISLFFYNDDLKNAANKARKELDILNGKPSQADAQGVKGSIAKWMPDIGICVLSVLVLILIAKIWNCQI